MEYNVEATKGVSEALKEGTAHSGQFSIIILNSDGTPGELNMPPVLEIVRAMSSDDNFNVTTTEKLARYCLMNKVIRLKYNNEPVGDFVINDMDTPWDAYDPLKKYPLALMFIINVCTAFVIKKSIPPRVVQQK